ncbi:hypothetical protein N8I77_011657 [Diaporthe amygdali]|uniref:Uncharacterized protein n=1 Tax=Phomopsis amygdali TaxID=1214568 RepID=A0AAD9S640_PHOAM|nr:hypothetical protein N8I77_011657 [Diaporthe amygdali]
MSFAMLEIATAKTGSRLSVLALLFTRVLSSSSHSHLNPRVDHLPLGLPDLPPGLFITYTGVLSGSLQLNSSNFPFDSTKCAAGSGTYFFADTANSTVRVGVNPPSIDPNPLFFMIQQGEPALLPPVPGSGTEIPTPTTPPLGPDSPTPLEPTAPSFTFANPTVQPVPIFSSRPRALLAAPGGLDVSQVMSDPLLPPSSTGSGGIQNLLFASIYTICTRDSRPCGMIRTTDQGTATYNTLEMLNLTDPDLLSTTASFDDDSGPSYTVRGDQATWASNDTIDWSGLEFFPPSNYTAEPEACTAYRYPPLVWNATTPFTYALRFANASATLSLVLAAPLGTVTLEFAGARAAGLDAADVLQVGRGAGGAPRWSFVNGTGFHFDGVTAVANDSVEGGGLFNGEDGLGSGAAGVGTWAGWGGGVALAAFFAALLL